MIGLSENTFGGEEVTLYYFRRQDSELLLWDPMKSAIMMHVAVITCFPLIKADMKGEAKKCIYLNITSLNCYREWLILNDCQNRRLIHKSSSIDSSTESFITVAQIWVAICLCIVNPLSSGIGLCASNINKERFLMGSAHYRKILSQVLLFPLFLCCH